MKEFYSRCIQIYEDYREAVPSYASAALAFYLLLILVPSFTLIAIGTSFLNLDLTFLENIIKGIVMPEYSSIIIEVLETRSFNTVAFVTMIISLYTVSRGVGNIYEISKHMYGDSEDESIFGYYIYTFKITIYLLLLIIGLIAVLAIKPLAYIYDILYPLFGVKHIILYFFMVFALMSIYLLVPRVKIHYSDAFQGALVASVLMLVLFYGFNIYIEFANFQSVYGPLAFVVIILFVFNWAAEIFYLGMYITNILHLRRSSNEKRTSRN